MRRILHPESNVTDKANRSGLGTVVSYSTSQKWSHEKGLVRSDCLNDSSLDANFGLRHFHPQKVIVAPDLLTHLSAVAHVQMAIAIGLKLMAKLFMYPKLRCCSLFVNFRWSI